MNRASHVIVKAARPTHVFLIEIIAAASHPSTKTGLCGSGSDEM